MKVPSRPPGSRWWSRSVLGASLFGAAVVTSACGTDARGVDACRRVEEARCRRAPGCGIDLGFIKYVGSGETQATEGCIRYYRDACLHGLVADEPGAPAVEACVSTLQTGSCDAVRAPESTTACAWLTPKTPATADAAADSTVVEDAGTDGQAGP